MLNRAAFFSHLRKRDSGVFGTSLSSAQVGGVEAVLDECERQGADLGQTAYILATGYGETGGRMQSVRENLNYSAASIREHFGAHRRQGKTPEELARNPRLLGDTVYGGEWGRKNLGNVKQGDGYNFRGFWIGQFTGRRHARNASEDLGIDLVAQPELLHKQGLGHKLLVLWMLRGRATGLKLSQFVKGDRRDYRGARSVWGGVDADKYVGYAKSFEAALIAGGWTKPAPVAKVPRYLGAKPKAPSGSNWFETLLGLLRVK